MDRLVTMRQHRIEALARALEPELRDHGEVGRFVEELGDAYLSEWRAAAVLAGHCCGWKMRTRVAPDGRYVRAVAMDRPVSDGEHVSAARRVQEALLNASPTPEP